IAFLRAHVPAGSTIVGEPADSYAYYLAADGLELNAMQAAQFQDSVLVNAFAANPALSYVLLTRIYPESTYAQWFADWNGHFPDLHWTLVAQLHDPELQLYHLADTSGNEQRASYLRLVEQAHEQGFSLTALPSYSTIDFRATLPWKGVDPRNNAPPAVQFAHGINVRSIVLPPYYPGMPPEVPPQVSAQLPPAWSGHGLLFFGTIAPWAADNAGADGVRLVFTIAQAHSRQVVELLNL